MSFYEAILLQPTWVIVWVTWLVIVIMASWVVLLFSKETRRDGLVVLAANIAVTILIQWMYERLGYVRLLGLSHVIFWTPLLVYLVWRLRRAQLPAPYRQVMLVLAASLFVSLLFDYADVARYLLGERAVMV